jgi:chromosome segregation ATPase
MEPAGAQAGQAGGGGAGGEDEMAATIEENEDLRKELELAEEDFNDLLRERAKLMHSLKSLKEVAAEQEEALEEKSAEVRRLGEAMAGLQDQKSKLQQQLKESNAAGKDAVDLLRRDLTAELSKARAELAAARSEEQRLRAENVTVKQALTQGREVDMLTADGARDQASRAQAAHEQEVAAHRETREALKTRQEALDAEAAIAAEAIAAAQRRADEALAAAAAAKEAQRSAESRLARVTSARDAAMARVEDLSRELAPYQASEGGQPPGREELQSLRQTVSELENALEAKNVELTRLEGDVENMRSIVSSRNSSSAARSPGAAGAAGGEYAGGREVEQKLRHMADSALRKQAQLEVLRSENKALQHQLDTERKRTREAQAMAAVATSSRHNLRGGFRGIMDGGDEERGDRGYGVREGPMARFRAPRAWPAGVVHFLGSLDKLTAQALGFLRKEPLIRMALLIYVVAVHVLLYGMLHYHVEATMTVPGAGVHAHPREGLVPHVKH